jgi:hypothetical protein
MTFISKVTEELTTKAAGPNSVFPGLETKKLIQNKRGTIIIQSAPPPLFFNPPLSIINQTPRKNRITTVISMLSFS